jgi:hypothetical protein
MYCRSGDDLVVIAGQLEAKTWWRNFGPDPEEVTLLLSGREQRRTARRLAPGSGGYDVARRTYRQAFPRAKLETDVPVLILTTVELG